jgi:putative helicase MOV10L1
VGTIDDYQGQEEKIIIISTTVSPDMLSWRDSANDPFGLDIGPLAMFRNAKRFNVAVTRAKVGMLGL